MYNKEKRHTPFLFRFCAPYQICLKIKITLNIKFLTIDIQSIQSRKPWNTAGQERMDEVESSLNSDSSKGRIDEVGKLQWIILKKSENNLSKAKRKHIYHYASFC
jgi:hypothetical protein